MKQRWMPDPKEVEDVLASIAIESTGNREQDEAHLLDAAIREVRLRHNYCPNGCVSSATGDLQQMDRMGPGSKSCPVCGFSYFGSL